MPVIESCLLENNSMKSFLFCELCHLVRYWSRNSETPEYSSYSKLMKTFWFDLLATFNRLIDNSIENSNEKIATIINSITDLLNYLKNAPEHNRRNMKVRFVDAANDADESSLPSSSETVQIKKTEEDAFLAELQQFIIKLSVSYFKRINDKPVNNKIAYLVKILSLYESKELFVALAKAYNSDADLLHFYNQNLKPLVKTENEEIDALVNLIFGMITHMNDPEKLVVLDSFKEVCRAKLI